MKHLIFVNDAYASSQLQSSFSKCIFNEMFQNKVLYLTLSHFFSSFFYLKKKNQFWVN